MKFRPTGRFALVLATALAPTAAMAAPPEAAAGAAPDATDGESETQSEGVSDESDERDERVEAARKRRREVADTMGAGLRNGFRIGGSAASMRVGALVQGRALAEFDEVDGASGRFALPIARLYADARFFDDHLALFLQPELAGGPRLLDAEVRATYDENFGVRAGFYRPFFLRSYRVGIPMLSLPGRGLVVERFTTGRRIGAQIEGTPFGGKFEYRLGAFNGAGGAMGSNVPADALLVGRVAWHPLGMLDYTQTPVASGIDDIKMTLGVNVAHERTPLAADVDAPTEKSLYPARTTLAVDATVMAPKLWLGATGIRRWEETGLGPRPAMGGYLQGGAHLGDSIFDVTVRTGGVDEQGVVVSNHEAGVNAYVVGDHLRLTAAYLCERTKGQGAGCRTHTFNLQAQLWF